MIELSVSKILVFIYLYYVILCIKLKDSTKQNLIVWHVRNLVGNLSQSSGAGNIQNNHLDGFYFQIGLNSHAANYILITVNILTNLVIEVFKILNIFELKFSLNSDESFLQIKILSFFYVVDKPEHDQQAGNKSSCASFTSSAVNGNDKLRIFKHFLEHIKDQLNEEDFTSWFMINPVYFYYLVIK